MTADLAIDRHGSTAEYQQHRKRGEDPCVECKAAKRDEMRRRRLRAFNRNRESAQNAARERAVWRLARMHPAQYRALVAEEMTKIGEVS